MDKSNPFSFSKASDYTDEEINTFWVDLGDKEYIDSIIEPQSRKSKFILGGKGTGKTHLLRHHSYQTLKLREKSLSGLDLIKSKKYLGVFLRANSLDANRFNSKTQDETINWQNLFGIFLELKLIDNLIEILIDIKNNSSTHNFNDKGFLNSLGYEINDPDFENLSNIGAFQEWIKLETKRINKSVNNYAFTATLSLTSSKFSFGGLINKIKEALTVWNSDFDNISILYLLDEIENFSSIEQQEVIQSLIRFSEGTSTFRISGRLYAIKTYSIIGNGEENREGSEFEIINLDEKLNAISNTEYKIFAKNFITRRLTLKNLIKNKENFDIFKCFESLKNNKFYEDVLDDQSLLEKSDSINFIKSFKKTLSDVPKIINADEIDQICFLLTNDFPAILQKHNILRFCKSFTPALSSIEQANSIRTSCFQSMNSSNENCTKSYNESYYHWNKDLLAQLSREWNKSWEYSGFDTFIHMSSNNPRNLLSILVSAYDLALFNNHDFINESPLTIEEQNHAAFENAKFIFEQDSNYGSKSEIAKKAIKRLSTILRTARFSLNIPEVSPLLVSFNDEDLTDNSRQAIQSALNYSFCFELKSGRPDRNSNRINRKLYLNPILSPIWNLPISRRGDLSLSPELVNSIFDQDKNEEFKTLLNSLNRKWNQPFTKNKLLLNQPDLFQND